MVGSAGTDQGSCRHDVVVVSITSLRRFFGALVVSTGLVRIAGRSETATKEAGFAR